ncbi:MAG: peptidoglycan editing factor PgeF, partial [bacterium]
LKGFSQKQDGNMKVYASTSVGLSEKNRQAFLLRLGLNSDDLVLAGSVHGNKVAVVGARNRGQIITGCDALVTTEVGVILGITAADCLPIYFWDEGAGVIAMAHAGWRGVQSRIVSEVLRVMRDDGASIQNIKVEIGPHIRECHFEVQEDLVKEFADDADSFKMVDRKHYLSLAKIVNKQLTQSGVLEQNIKQDGGCTFCENKYFSYRRDKPKEVEAQLGYIVIK